VAAFTGIDGRFDQEYTLRVEIQRKKGFHAFQVKKTVLRMFIA
jgi:hypothetical protein